MRLSHSFYARGAGIVSRELLGKRLVRLQNGRCLSGIIVETEAYCDSVEPDLACHAARANNGKPTERTAVIFGPAGFAYVYFIYGMYWMFNVVTGQAGQANVVLVRALEPVEGVDEMKVNRNGRSALTNGPGKLAQALQIDKTLSGANLCDPNGVLWIEDAPTIPKTAIQTGPRIGLGKTPEPWYSVPWRYWIRDNKHVSVR